MSVEVDVLGALLAAAFVEELSPTERRRCIDIALGLVPADTRVSDSDHEATS
jgi:hypothetical protein